jgi:AAA15 family ATPase/GTPase
MFTTIKFQNFKSLKDFTIRLRDINVLVGPNNAGKSTVLDAFRTISVALNFASRRLPQPIQFKNKTVVGYDIPATQIPISLTNIHSDYQATEETSVTFNLENGNELQLEFHDSSRCILTIDSKQRTATTAQFKRNFPVSVYAFPTLGPLEEEKSF